MSIYARLGAPAKKDGSPTRPKKENGLFTPSARDFAALRFGVCISESFFFLNTFGRVVSVETYGENQECHLH